VWRDLIREVLDALKSPLLRVWIFLASLATLALPERTLGWFGLQTQMASARPWVSGIFILSGSLLVTHTLGWLVSRVNAFKARRANVEYLHHLTWEEARILVGYIDYDRRAQSMRGDDGHVLRLAERDILYKVGSGSPSGKDWSPFCIRPWAELYLTTTPQLLDVWRKDKTRAAHEPVRNQ
jgi:superinfection exclusion protein B